MTADEYQPQAEPMTYAERLQRLTLKKVLEKLEVMAAEGRTTPDAADPPARNRKAPSRRQEG